MKPKILYRDDGVEFHLEDDGCYYIAESDRFSGSRIGYEYETLIAYDTICETLEEAQLNGEAERIGLRWTELKEGGVVLEHFDRKKKEWKPIPWVNE